MKRKLKKTFIETCVILGLLIASSVIIGLALCGLKLILDLIIFNETITTILSYLIILFFSIFVVNICLYKDEEEEKHDERF